MSFAEECALPNFNKVFKDVNKYLLWIKKVLKVILKEKTGSDNILKLKSNDFIDGGMKHLQISKFYHLYLHPRSYNFNVRLKLKKCPDRACLKR